MLVEGSANVLIGDDEGQGQCAGGSSRSCETVQKERLVISIKDQLTEEGIPDMSITVRAPDGKEREYRTDANGDIVITEAKSGLYAVIQSDGSQLVLEHHSTEDLD